MVKLGVNEFCDVLFVNLLLLNFKGGNKFLLYFIGWWVFCLFFFLINIICVEEWYFNYVMLWK